jgi:hypothetical protein
MEGAIVLAFLLGGGLSEVVEAVIVWTRRKFNAWVGCEMSRVPNLEKLRITSPRIPPFGKIQSSWRILRFSGKSCIELRLDPLKRLEYLRTLNLSAISSLFGF